MKKLFGCLLLILMFGIAGCSKGTKPEDVIGKVMSHYTSIKQYTYDAQMEIAREETTIKFDISVSYLEPNFYKVVLRNKESNHLQAIVKNDDGVFVLTPSLNKQFKFSSDWPLNSSHAYLMQSLMKDIANDENCSITTTGTTIEISTAVVHKTNAQLTHQKIVLDKKTYNPMSVTVYNEQDEAIMCVTFSNINWKPSLKKTDFIVERINTTLQLELAEGSILADLDGCVPAYVLDGSALAGSSQAEQYRIYTYNGDMQYTIACMVVEDIGVSSITRYYGEPVLLDCGFGALTDNSLTFYHGSIMVTIYATELDSEQMVAIANSFGQYIAS